MHGIQFSVDIWDKNRLSKENVLIEDHASFFLTSDGVEPNYAAQYPLSPDVRASVELKSKSELPEYTHFKNGCN